jgi:ATP-dependent helicase HrpA
LSEEISVLTNKLEQVACKDYLRLSKQLYKVSQRLGKGMPSDKIVSQLVSDIDASINLVVARRQQIPILSYPDLPVAQRVDDILSALAANQVVIIAGETGSGKTTQLPKICLQAGLGVKGLIGHTQPRRLAARTVANRISEELQVPLGQQVGYQVRFTDDTGPNTLVKLMTDGILLAEIQNDKQLKKYDAIIIDEAHERSLNIDFLLGYLKRLLPQRPDLKLIITSATIDVKRFSEHFNNAPIISVEGRSYPVEVDYLPVSVDADDKTSSNISDQVLAAVEYLEKIEREGRGVSQGDALVFLPGEREIRECALTLRRKGSSNLSVLPLYARLGQSEQQLIFHPRSNAGRRVILATNVAETSITVPGIHYVIDSGVARMSRYSARSKVQRLPIEAVSQASADQRKGRCGRVAKGICVRLYSEEDFLSRPPYTDPEIQRTNLAAVILQMAKMRLGEVAQFPFIDKPDGRYIRDGERTLEELGALDPSGKLTDLGWQLAKLPVDPRIGRIVLAGAKQGCLREVLIIASAMSVQDPKERPADKKDAAQTKHARFDQKGSDFMAWPALWDYFEQQRQDLSSNQLRKLCQREFLSYMRMQEWRDLHRQLKLVTKQLNLRENNTAAGETLVHRALLAGLVSQVGLRDERKEFIGTRGRRFLVFPGSSAYKKPPKWIVSAELVETTKLYARNNGKIEPEWILEYADHLVKRQYKDPFWSTKRGEVQALETISLYGLVISDNTRVSYGNIDATIAREVFIRGCLVERKYKGNAIFWRYNCQLIDDVEELEAKTRRADIALTDDELFEFYSERIPKEIVNLAGFEAWRKIVEKSDKELLLLNRNKVMARADGQNQVQFPSSLAWQDFELPLHYRFQPGHEDDGVTVDLPIAILNRVPIALFEWLVPGLLRDKCIALIKTLPKNIRKNFVPVPNYVDDILAKVNSGNVALSKSLTDSLSKIKRIAINADDWREELLEPFYLMNCRVLASDGSVVAKGRNIKELVAIHRDKLKQDIAAENKTGLADQSTDWNFGDLKPMVQLKQAGVDINAYPALVEIGEKVALRLTDSVEEAAAATKFGVIRLLINATAKQAKQLKKDLLKGNAYALHLSLLGDRESFVDGLVKAIYWDTFLYKQSMPRTKEEFDQRVVANKANLITSGNEFEKLFKQVLEQHYHAQQLLTKLTPAMAAVKNDVVEQISALMYPDFMLYVPLNRLKNYPRYFKAIVFRLERLAGQYQKDKQASIHVAKHWYNLQAKLAKEFFQLDDDSQLAEYRWMIEEYRVSLFAQKLKTPLPVSDKRLQQCWENSELSSN